MKLLKHKNSESVHLLTRRSKAFKRCANQLGNKSSLRSEHAGKEETWMWNASDFSDGELKEAYDAAQKEVVERTKEREEVDSLRLE